MPDASSTPGFDPTSPAFVRVAAAVKNARRILVLTGAGVSAESGIPTFRGKDGWWRQLEPQRLATMSAFRHDPKLVWEWYEYRRQLVAKAEPNAAHRAIAQLEAAGKEIFLVTQNVDDLHERAGSRHVVHIHGSIWTVCCMQEGIESEDRRVPLPELPPLCGCGALLRPGVVWFDEQLPIPACAEIDSYFSGGEKIDLAFVVGTYVTFHYIEAWALAAREHGALLVEVNPDETALSGQADVVLRAKAGEVFSALLKDSGVGAAVNAKPEGFR